MAEGTNPPRQTGWLRRAEQAVLALIVAVALAAMAIAWLYQGGHRGQLIEIDRVDSSEITFSVDINRASWPELAQLPNVGEVLARRIVESRAAEGPFRDHDDLQRVRGIGPKTVEAVRPYLLPMPAAESVADNVRAGDG